MSGSKAKGKARAAVPNNTRAVQKRSSFASAATRSSFAAALASQNTSSSSSDTTGDLSHNFSTAKSNSNTMTDITDSSVNRSLLPDKSDQELTYEELVKVLNSSIASSSPENSKLTITEAIPSMRELVSLRYDLKRLLEISTTQLSECENNLSNLKRLSTALDRESTKRMKVINAAAANSAAATESKNKTLAARTDSSTDLKESQTVSENNEKSSAEPENDKKLNDSVIIKTETTDVETSALFTDNIGLSEPDTRYKTPPEYEKNPKSEFVESQELPTAALNLFEDQVKGLPITGKEYLLKKYAVSSYPEDDLKDWLPGVIPDLDFTKAKPPNQVQFSTFASYIEPYFRPYVEEDLHFLEQKLAGGSYDYSYAPALTGTGAAAQAAAALSAAKRTQLSPYVIPKLGRLYSEVWKEQDGPNPGYSLNPPNPPRAKEVLPHGSSSQITDAELEKNELSCGPLASRLLSAILSEDYIENATVDNSNSEPSSDNNNNNNMSNIKTEKPSDDTSNPNEGDADKPDIENGESVIKQEIKSEDAGNDQTSESLDDEGQNENDVTKGKSSTLENTNWRVRVKNKDFLSLEERLKQELKYVGIIDIGMLKKEEEKKQNFEELADSPIVSGHKVSANTALNGEDTNESESKFIKPNETFDIDWVNGREDDEISTELRYLQRQLRRVSILNMTYQRVLHPIVQQQLAWQEYSHILEDLDKQVDQAYMRRNRATTRIKKKKSSATHNHSTANGGSGSSNNSHAAGSSGPGSAAANAAEQGHRMRSLLDKRLKWINMIGPVFESSKKMKSMPKESVFSQIDVEALMQDADSTKFGDPSSRFGSGNGSNGSAGNGNNENEVEEAMMNAFDKTRSGTPSAKVDDLYGIVSTN